MYFYLNQLEPKLALTAFLSTQADILVGVNYYTTTDFLSQHWGKKKKRKEEEVKRLGYCAFSAQKSKKQVVRLYVLFVPMENSVFI